ncbi:hypothetical protein N7478_012072 [Penicillium angulare]|uniref:uncharacterized protein n=1 Tax=Penicillium angulare TaxID=116970 RepID=UPI002540BE35|nr:uncharacterized protein N7478_012072 [Penicillium angulare]KAJ5260467.1 hypothetical protein N7478_012072 [Penicillium angulare]
MPSILNKVISRKESSTFTDTERKDRKWDDRSQGGAEWTVFSRSLGCKCPGPEREAEGLLLGPRVCPNGSIITVDTDVLYRINGQKKLGEEGRRKDAIFAVLLDVTLPQSGNVCLLLKEFRPNIDKAVSSKCFRGEPISLKLSGIFVLLFGQGHTLAGRNHDALVDAQQLALLAKLFCDLCRPPAKRKFGRR